MSNRRERRKSTEEQIEELTEQLKVITLQLSRLQEQVQQEREEAIAEVVQGIEQRPRSFQIGDLVRITNNYQNLRGAEGRVTNINTSFVTIRLHSGRQVVRGIQNVVIINQSQDE